MQTIRKSGSSPHSSGETLSPSKTTISGETLSPPETPTSGETLAATGSRTSGRPGIRAIRTGFFALVSALGPGLIVMIGDNDAGGVISYAATGATYGFGVFALFILLLAPVTFTVQEMSMRLSAVSQKPFPVLVFQHFGKGWGVFALAALLAENLLTLVTEFIGMSVGLSLLGISFDAADLVSMICVIFFALFGKYWTTERLALLVGMLNAVFVWIAWVGHPDFARTAHSIFSAQGAGTAGFWFFVMATIGKPQVAVCMRHEGLRSAVCM